MFFFEAQPLSNWIMWLVVFVALILLNEVGRRYKAGGIILFMILPVILTLFVWPKTTKGTSVSDWFHYAKVYSSLAGCIGFWLLRHVKGASTKKWVLCFPPLILAINICEAVARDFQIGGLHLNKEAFEGMVLVSGSWNYMNGIAGILNILTITGWFGICLRKKTDRDGSKDMLWPDMLWFWIIAYDLWNFAYTYNCLPGHAWYCGFALLLAPTLCAFTVGKGAWLQHRAQTLAIWCMFAQTFPAFIDKGAFAVASSYNPVPLFAFSFGALAVNIAVFAYMVYKVIKTRKNPYLGELYTDLRSYREIKSLAELDEKRGNRVQPISKTM
jgi:hypothetical protein